MELDVWTGDWGLPSIDLQCLSVMACCKFANVPIKIQKTNSPWRSPSGDLPFLTYADGKEARLAKILEEFSKQDYDVDQSLTGKQSADAMAFRALVDEKLLPALQHLWWVDTKVYEDFTRPWFAKAVGFPFSFYWPQRKHNRVIAQVRAPYRGDSLLSEAELESLVIRNGKECLNLLSAKLGSNNYFFGDRPTSLDAVVFGYLAPLLKMPISSQLQNHLKGCRSLVNFIQRILSQYFPLTPEEEEAQRKQDEEARQRTAEQTEFPHRKRDFFLAGVAFVAAMAAYALYSGIVQIEFVNVDKKTASRGEAEVVQISADGDDED